MRILLVEDDATTAFLESEALKYIGCKVVQAESAFRAIELLNAQTSADFSELDQIALYGSKLEKIGFKKKFFTPSPI